MHTRIHTHIHTHNSPKKQIQYFGAKLWRGPAGRPAGRPASRWQVSVTCRPAGYGGNPDFKVREGYVLKIKHVSEFRVNHVLKL